MANMSDVAQLAGVSESTVSHVINETRTVLPETAERVRSAIRELGLLPQHVGPVVGPRFNHEHWRCRARYWQLLLCRDHSRHRSGSFRVWLHVASRPHPRRSRR